MLYALIAFVLFFVVLQFAVYMLPVLLIALIALWVLGMIFKPDVKVYSHTFVFPSSQTTDPSRPVRIDHASGPDVIDAEFTERKDSASA